MNLEPTAEDRAVDLVAVLKKAEQANDIQKRSAEIERELAREPYVCEVIVSLGLLARTALPAAIRRCLEAESESKQFCDLLGNLLARCFRDGGQCLADKYEGDLKWAATDADQIISEYITRAEASEAEVARLREAIRQHHAQRKDDRCHLDDDMLYAAAGLEPADTSLPPKCEFLESCRRYWEQRQRPGAVPMAGAMTMAQLEAEVKRYRELWMQADLELLRQRTVQKHTERRES